MLKVCGSWMHIAGAGPFGCILLDKHEGPHKSLHNAYRNGPETKPEDFAKGSEGRAVLYWSDKEPMFTTCTPCHAKLHWHCHGEWQDPDGHHICTCGCEAA